MWNEAHGVSMSAMHKSLGLFVEACQPTAGRHESDSNLESHPHKPRSHGFDDEEVATTSVGLLVNGSDRLSQLNPAHLCRSLMANSSVAYGVHTWSRPHAS